MGIDENKVILNEVLSVYEGVVVCWKGECYGCWLDVFLCVVYNFDFLVYIVYQDLSWVEQCLFWKGNDYFDGINVFFLELQEKMYKIQNWVMLVCYCGCICCFECDGGCLCQEVIYVLVNKILIIDLVDLFVKDLLIFFEGLEFNENEQKIGKCLLLEVINCFCFMVNLGLGYLSFFCLFNILSGGEMQCINLMCILGSNLISFMYLFDEFSIGLYLRDIGCLVSVLECLCDLGNIVVVVEYEEDVIKNVDYFIDIGFVAGIYGGEVVFVGFYEDIYDEVIESLIIKYMSGCMEILLLEICCLVSNFLKVCSVCQYNLKNIDVDILFNVIMVVMGVFGSGKISLVKFIIYWVLKKELEEFYSKFFGIFKGLDGEVGMLMQVELVS